MEFIIYFLTKYRFLETVEKVKNLDSNKTKLIRKTLEEQGVEQTIIKNTIESLVESEIDNVKIRKLMQHYYIPIVYTENKVDWIKHIIDVESEYDFIKNLIQIVDDLDKYYDWWMFSKLDEHLDKNIYIPYFIQGRTKKFIPDFIFWLKKGNNYTILFIDSKGGAYSSYLDKLEGYKSIFMENGKEKVFNLQNQNLKVKVKLKFYTTSGVENISGDKSFWIDKNTINDRLIYQNN